MLAIDFSSNQKAETSNASNVVLHVPKYREKKMRYDRTSPGCGWLAKWLWSRWFVRTYPLIIVVKHVI
jgi:hypothetical protein